MASDYNELRRPSRHHMKLRLHPTTCHPPCLPKALHLRCPGNPAAAIGLAVHDAEIARGTLGRRCGRRVQRPEPRQPSEGETPAAEPRYLTTSGDCPWRRADDTPQDSSDAPPPQDVITRGKRRQHADAAPRTAEPPLAQPRPAKPSMLYTASITCPKRLGALRWNPAAQPQDASPVTGCSRTRRRHTGSPTALRRRHSRFLRVAQVRAAHS